MTFVSSLNFWRPLIAILSVVFFIPTAFADYSAFQNHLISTVGPDNVNNAMVRGSNSEFTIEFIATTSISLFDRIDIALCRNDGTTGGVIELEVRSTASTTGPIIASSTLAINNGNVYSTTTTPGQGCNYGIEGVNEHMSTFVLNNNIQTVSGVTWWFRFRIVGNASYFLVSLNNGVTFGFYQNLLFWDDRNSPYKIGSDLASPIVTGYALGSAPTNQNQGIYNASSTVSICETFDVGCYLTTAFSWAFYPTATVYLFEQTPTIASTTPFNYIYETGELWEIIFAGTATGTQTLQIDFTPLGMATTSLTAGTLQSTVQGAGFFTTIRNWVEIFLYLGFAFGMFRIVLGIIGWGHFNDGGNKMQRVGNVIKGASNRYKL